MKKSFKILIVFISLLSFAAMAWAVDSTVYQKEDCVGNACVLRISWTTSDAGAFTGFETMGVNGWIDAVETDPDGTAAPTANYDISIANKLVSSVNEGGTFTTRTTTRGICGDTGVWVGADITTAGDGVLANRVAATAEVTRLFLDATDDPQAGGLMNLGPLLIDISNAGNSKKGMINIYFTKPPLSKP